MQFAYLTLSLLLFISISARSLSRESEIHALHKAKQLEYACNRGVIESMTPSGSYFPNFQINPATSSMNRHCKHIELSCCTDNEILTFVNQQDNKKEEFKVVEEYVNKLVDILNAIDVQKLQDLMMATSIQTSRTNEFAIEDVEQYINELKKLSVDALEGLNSLKQVYFDYFSGVMCTICDAKKNLFMHDFEDSTRNKHILRLDLSEEGCMSNFKRQIEFIGLVKFIFKYLDLAQFFEHRDNGELNLCNGFDYSYYEEQKELIDKCMNLQSGAIFSHDECKEACTLLNNFVKWESFEFFYVLDRVYYVINVKYGSESDLEAQKEFEERVTQLEKFYDLAPEPYFYLHSTQDGDVSAQGINILEAIPVYESTLAIIPSLFSLLLLSIMF